MKTLITHINPHLDDIVGIWLLKKYNPEFKEALVEFMSASHKGEQETEDRVFVGTGGGKFDEHKEGLDTCAGTLVYEYLDQNGFIPSDATKKALEKLIHWNFLIDTGRGSNSEFDEFSVQSFIRTKDSKDDSSLKSVELGREVLDRILEVLIKKEQSILDWEKRVEFESKFGKGYGVESETVNREFCREQDGEIYIMVDPKNKGVQYFSPQVDIEEIYKKVKEQDSEADWFLHQSHHMVICGSSSAPDSKPTKLSFEQLIDVAKQA
jgi:hypothetical protein